MLAPQLARAGAQDAAVFPPPAQVGIGITLLFQVHAAQRPAPAPAAERGMIAWHVGRKAAGRGGRGEAGEKSEGEHGIAHGAVSPVECGWRITATENSVTNGSGQVAWVTGAGTGI